MRLILLQRRLPCLALSCLALCCVVATLGLCGCHPPHPTDSGAPSPTVAGNSAPKTPSLPAVPQAAAPSVPPPPVAAPTTATTAVPSTPTRAASPTHPTVIKPTHPAKIYTHTGSIRPIKPGKEGAGIVVCEPLAAQESAALAPFGAGCARWLQFNVGGQGALGATPLWTSVDRARRELGRQDLQLTPADAFRLAGMTGTPYVAVGELSGTVEQATITYHLYRVEGRKDLGATLSLVGTQEQIVTALPALARDMATLLGVKSPHLPARVEGTAADLAQVGGLPWLPTPDTAPEQRQRLLALAAKMPLADVLALRSSPTRSAVTLAPVVDRLLKQTPENPITFAEIGWEASDLLPKYTALIRADRQRYPGSYLLALTDVWLQRTVQNPAAEYRAAQQVVNNAPRNPDARLTLGETFSEKAERVRKGRYFSQLNRQEAATVEQIYPQWLAAVQRATELDPLFGKAWLRVSTAASFDGAKSIATAAFWKAVDLDRENPEVYWWGLQMFQRKWYEDRESLLKVAKMAATVFHYDDKVFGVVDALTQSGMTQEANSLLAEIVAHNREALRVNPADSKVRCTLAWALKEQKNYVDAAALLRDYVRQNPNDASAHYTLGQIYYDNNRYTRAIPEFQQAVKLNPDNYQAWMNLGYTLKLLGRFSAAQQPFLMAVRIRPLSDNGWGLLGDSYLNDRKPGPAINAYRRSIEINPDSNVAWYHMSIALSRMNRFKEAIQAGERALQLKPDEVGAHETLTYSYVMNNQPEESARECRAVLAVQPTNAMAHVNLGYALAKLGKRAEARAEWQYVLQQHNASAECIREAEKGLKQNPENNRP